MTNPFRTEVKRNLQSRGINGKFRLITKEVDETLVVRLHLFDKKDEFMYNLQGGQRLLDQWWADFWIQWFDLHAG